MSAVAVTKNLPDATRAKSKKKQRQKSFKKNDVAKKCSKLANSLRTKSASTLIGDSRVSKLELGHRFRRRAEMVFITKVSDRYNDNGIQGYSRILGFYLTSEHVFISFVELRKAGYSLWHRKSKTFLATLDSKMPITGA